MSNRCTHLRPKGDSGPGPPAPRHPARTSAPSELPPNRTLRTAPSEPPRRATGYGLRVRSTDNTDRTTGAGRTDTVAPDNRAKRTDAAAPGAAELRGSGAWRSFHPDIRSFHPAGQNPGYFRNRPHSNTPARFLPRCGGENADRHGSVRPGRFGDSEKSDYLATESQTPRRVSDDRN